MALLTSPIVPARCPRCRALLQSASTPGMRTPRADDLVVCFDCGALLVFTQDLALRDLQLQDLPHYNPALLEQAYAMSGAIKAEKLQHPRTRSKQRH